MTHSIDIALACWLGGAVSVVVFFAWQLLRDRREAIALCPKCKLTQMEAVSIDCDCEFAQHAFDAWRRDIFHAYPVDTHTNHGTY